MSAAAYDFTIEAHATFEFDLLINPDTGGFQLDDCRAVMQVRPTADSRTVLTELSTENGKLVIMSQRGGYIRGILSVDETARIDWEEGYYDIVLILPNRYVYRLAEGKITYKQGVTKWVA